MSSAMLACHHTTQPKHLYEGQDRLYGGPGLFSAVRCTSCGLVSTLPRLEFDELDQYYPETYGAHQLEANRSTLRQRLGGLVDHARFVAGMRLGAFRTLTQGPPGRLLDVGCGRGDLGEWFSDRGWEVAGVEPSRTAARLAAERGLDMHVGSLDDAPWPARSFDVVIFNHSLEHVPDPLLALRQAAGFLRPGGRLAVAVPNFGAWQRRLFGTYWFQLDLPRHLQHFDRASLVAMARAAGFEPTEVRTSSTMVGIVMSCRNAFDGRLSWSYATTTLMTYLLYPLVLLADAASREADCLHLVAQLPLSNR